MFEANRIKAKKVSDRYFFILARDNQQEEARIGFALAKKKIKLAVARNRIKRIVREQFRYLKTEGAALDLVIMANRSCVDASNRELAQSFQNLWRRLQKLSKTS